MNKRPFLFLIFLLGALWISACSDEATIPDSTLNILTVDTTPSLEGWLPAVSACASSLENTGIITTLQTSEALDQSQADLVLRLGSRPDGELTVTWLGTETLTVVVGDGIPAKNLSLDSLRRIFMGSYTSWAQVPEVSAVKPDLNQPIAVLSWPEGNDVRTAFEENILNGEQISDKAQTYFTVERMEAVLAEQPFAIVFMLSSQVPSGIQPISLTGGEPTIRDVYVLGVTSSSPDGMLKQLLWCLQQARSP